MSDERYNPYAGKWVNKPEDVPNGPHFAIITFEPYTEATGYEKPGEYIPSSIKAVYRVYAEHKDWEREIQELSVRPSYGAKTPFVALANCTRASIETVVKVEIK